jgi:hypothetical protein
MAGHLVRPVSLMADRLHSHVRGAGAVNHVQEGEGGGGDGDKDKGGKDGPDNLKMVMMSEGDTDGAPIVGSVGGEDMVDGACDEEHDGDQDDHQPIMEVGDERHRTSRRALESALSGNRLAGSDEGGSLLLSFCQHSGGEQGGGQSGADRKGRDVRGGGDAGRILASAVTADGELLLLL